MFSLDSFSNSRRNSILFLRQLSSILVVIGAVMIFGGRTAKFDLTIGNEHRVFTGSVAPGMTVLDAMNASMLAGHITMQFMIGENDQTKIIALDGQPAPVSPERLSFSLNGIPISVDQIHHVVIRPHDVVALVVTPQ
jgi:hypothetical protein